MAKTAAIEKTIDIWKKKKWHKVIAPKLFNEMMIGETPALEPNSVPGRTLRINMMTLTGDIKKQNFDVTFEIEKVMGDTAYSIIRKFEMNASSIRRLVRKAKNRVDDSFICATSDNKNVRIKPFLVTFAMTTNSVITKLRKKAKEFLLRSIRGMTYDTLCREIVSFNIQRTMRANLCKTYPLRVCDIRVMELQKGDFVLPPEIANLVIAPEAPQQAPQEKKEVSQSKQEEAPAQQKEEAA